MKNVFVYGSLMFGQVWEQIIRRTYSRHEARLSGYKRLDVKGELYPGLVRLNKGRVDGVVYLNVRNKDVLLLDRFEGKHYKRVSTLIYTQGIGEVKADVYVIRKRYRNLLAHSEWDAEKFEVNGVQKFLSMHAGNRGFP